MWGLSFFCCTFSLMISPSCTLPRHLFASHFLMPSDGCGNILQEISILFPVNPFLHFHAGVPIDSEGERKSTAVSKKTVFNFHLFASYF